MLLCFFLFFYYPTGKLSNKTLSTLSTPSNSLSQTLTSLSHCPRPDSILNVTNPSKLDVTNPPANPFHQTSKPTQAPSRWSTPQTHAFDPPLIHTFDPSRPSLMLSTLSNSHLFIPPLPPPIHTSDSTRLQVSCLYLFHIHA